jgi:hypothetical protein
MQEAARSWAMHRIAVIQAEAGHFQAAKRTVSQIGDYCEKGPSEVTVVWFCDGMPVYDHPPASTHQAFPWQTLRSASDYRVESSVPSDVPAGLPANYLAPDSRHGVVTDFSDERDAQGTRVTSRTYADGHVVIETPRSAG